MKRVLRSLTVFILAVTLSVIPLESVNAGTVYMTDNLEHDEGYIFVGESHSVLAANNINRAVDENRKVIGLDDVYYHYLWDSSIYSFDGNANTFTMWGNLFFVFEGNEESDAQTQLSREYIYSDGNGNRGVAVEKIHEIIEKNPKIKHWNIISYHGAVSALNWEENAPYYVSSYKNWINYEFPEADCYFLSHSTMTKYYSQKKDAYKFDDAIKAAFPDNYLDFTDFYKARQSDHMIDTIHWDEETYDELIVDMIKKIKLNNSYKNALENKSSSPSYLYYG